jgi:acyl-CoA thioester hydrolase
MFHLTIKPRFCETDALGHINHAVLPTWFEEGRIDIFRIFNPSLSIDSWNLILKHLEIDFKAQIWQVHPVDIETGIEKIGNTSFTVAQRANQEGTVCAEGRVVLVHFDYKSQKPAPIPTPIREQLEQHMAGV